MSSNHKNSILNSIKIIIVGFLLATGVSYLFAWTGPTGTPPSGNVAAPLNTSYSSQSKLGQLFVNTSTSSPYTNGLVAFGESVFTSNVSGQPAIEINDGNAATGSVLTSIDGNGTAKWEAGGASSGVTTITAGHHISVSPTGGTGNVTVTASSTLVSGGCYTNGYYAGFDGENSGVDYVGWGNAQGSNNSNNGGTYASCAGCPSGYITQQIVGNYTAYAGGSASNNEAMLCLQQ